MPDTHNSATDQPFAWTLLQGMRETENHFNEIQAGYRKQAGSWLLAAFGAMGFLLSNKLTDLPFSVEQIIFGVALAASSGLALIWLLDLCFYHRLLHSCFLEGLKLEDQHPELPQIRHQMLDNLRSVGRERQPGGSGRESRQTRDARTYNPAGRFYAGMIIAPLVFGSAPLTVHAFKTGSWWYGLPFVLAVAALILLIALIVPRYSTHGLPHECSRQR